VIIKKVEELLGAECIGSYDSGHMGSSILRFQYNEKDRGKFVVKFAPADDAMAMMDIEANMRGYRKIKTIGGSRLTPSGLREIPVANGKALVMNDLGSSMRVGDGGLDACVLMWRHFSRAISQTTVQMDTNSIRFPMFVTEVIRHIERFSHGRVSNLVGAIRESDWIDECGKVAIMLLDFTPDNLFVNETRLSFIDPWNQEMYLGHPAVSIGQFVSLMKLYDMRDADKSAFVLKECCMDELPSILECDVSLVERAFRLGATLQFVLSSYVRQKSDPSRAASLLVEACNLWR
jgi:hypothetical protein